MTILKIILIVLAVIIAIILAIVLLILFIPFEYVLNIKYIEDQRVDVKLTYIIFKIKGFLILSPEPSYELKVWNKILVTSEKNESEDENDSEDSIEETDFIENKDLKNEIKESKKTIKDLFVSAKKLETKQKEEVNKKNNDNNYLSLDDDNENVEDTNEEEYEESKLVEENYFDETLEKKKEKAFNVIDKFKNIFSSNEIYVAKKIASEAIGVLNILKPDKLDVDIKYGSKDPYTMGLLFSIAAPIYSFLGKKLKLKQNGISNFTEANLSIVGHPQLYKLASSIIRLLLDKKTRKFIFKKKKK